MRNILRTAAKVLAVLLWVAKGLLLLLAVAAAVMWPVSCGRSMGVSAERNTAGPASGERRWYYAACLDGRAVLGWRREDARGRPELAGIRGAIASGGDGWRWQRQSTAYTWYEGFWRSRWGPLRWRLTDGNDLNLTYGYRYIAAPLWGVSLVAGAWPLASIVLLIRRRRKRRRLARVGCCQQCGYDLRATAEKNGPFLPRCPECGAESASSSPKNL